MDQSKKQSIETPFGDNRVAVAAAVSAQAKVKDISNQDSPTSSPKDHKFSLLLIAVVALAALVGGYMLFTGPLSTYTRAFVQGTPSATNSYVFAYPLTIKADGQEISTVSLFVADEQSRPLAGKRVTLQTSSGTLDRPDGLTDQSGQISFKLSLPEPDMAQISFLVEGEPFDKQITVQGE